jgi:mycothiol synthase
MTAGMHDYAADTIVRPIREDDYGPIRQFLIDTYPITGPGFNWEIRRWDGWRWYSADPVWQPEWEAQFRLWETPDGQIAALVHPDGAGLAALQVHPHYRHLEPAMLDWAEAHFSALDEQHQRVMLVFAYAYDAPRCELLESRGYVKQSFGAMHRRMVLGDAVRYPRPPLAAGYTLAVMRKGNHEDAHRLAVMLNESFNRDFHSAAEFVSFSTLAPCYREDLHLAALAPDGSLAAHVAVIYDEANRRALFEPVGTHPAHQRKGLAKALMYEGLHRVRALGARILTVDTGDAVPANRLYNSMGFTEHYRGYYWRKVLA